MAGEATKTANQADAAKITAEAAAREEAEQKLREKIREEERAKILAELADVKANPNKPEPGPRYRTRERCYLKDILFEPGQEFTYHGVPGHYMEPLNDEARKMKQKHNIGDTAIMVVDALTQVVAPAQGPKA